MINRVLLALLLAGGLVACSSGGGTEAGTVRTTTTPTTAATTSAGTPTPEPPRPSALSLKTVQLKAGDAPRNSTFAFGSLWVPAHHAGVVIRIDPTMGKTVARIPAGVGPGSVVASDDALWVVDYLTPHLMEIDPARNTLRRKIPLLAESCCQAAVAGDTVWVASGDPGTGQLEGFDIRTGKRVMRVPGLWSPVFLLGRLWAINGDGDLVQVDLRTGAVTKTKAPRGLHIVAGSVSHNLFWAAWDGVVVGIDRTGTVKIQAKRDNGFQLIYGQAIVVATPSTVWVGTEVGELFRLDPATGIGTMITFVKSGISLLVPVGDRVWVGGFGGDTLESFAG